MKTISFLFLILLSCSGQPEVSRAPVSMAPNVDSLKALPHRRRLFVPDNAPRELPAVQKFPGRDFHRAVAFELTGNPPDSYAGAVFEEQTGKKVELSAEQVDAFLQLINNRNSYRATEMACFEPGVGLVFYDAGDVPVAYLSLCLNCHNMYSEPPLELGLRRVSKTGFNEPTLKRLKEMFVSWGVVE